MRIGGAEDAALFADAIRVGSLVDDPQVGCAPEHVARDGARGRCDGVRERPRSEPLERPARQDRLHAPVVPEHHGIDAEPAESNTY